MNKPPMLPKGSPELYAKAVELHKLAFKKEKYNKERYQKKTGHMIRALFGHYAWTLKDLENPELERIIDICEHKIERKNRRCA